MLRKKTDIIAGDHSIVIFKRETTECICLIDDKHTFQLHYENDIRRIKRCNCNQYSCWWFQIPSDYVLTRFYPS